MSILPKDFSEAVALVRLKYASGAATREIAPLSQLTHLGARDFCYAALNKVSRSFAIVIQQLPEELKDPVCIFYLVLRSLDTVEDDMKCELSKKEPLLRNFYTFLEIDTWNLEGVGQGKDAEEYKTLLKEFPKVIKIFKSLDVKYQAVIKDITKRMGSGMADFATVGSIKTVADYNLYCHYVAGLVGVGLTNLFSASGLEDPNLKDLTHHSNSMGLFLQKTNIIRDYLEDLDEGRTWWPAEIWSKYATELSEFKQNPTSTKSLSCLNHMIADALSLVPDVLSYLSRLQNEAIFSFCAIPQVMAIATLEKLYNNSQVFQKNVKIHKALSAKVVVNTRSAAVAYAFFDRFAKSLSGKISVGDPSTPRIGSLVAQCRSVTAPYGSSEYSLPLWGLLSLIFAFLFTQPGWTKYIILALVFLSLYVFDIQRFQSLKRAHQQHQQQQQEHQRRLSMKDGNLESKTSQRLHRSTSRLGGTLQKGDTLLKELNDDFPELVEDFLKHLRDDYKLDSKHVNRVKKLLDYNILGGKVNRGTMVLTTIQSFCFDSKNERDEGIDYELTMKAGRLIAWCIEILQGLFLVADDIMDHSELRRGKPCWYKLEEVQLDAINDTLILESVIWYLLKKRLSGGYFDRVYLKLVELFQEVSLQTQVGQMMDLSSQPQGRKGPDILKTFSLELHRNIVVYKTAFYSFYLPIAAGMILCGHDEPQELKIAEQICVELGEKFQIEDDYLDCYGSKEMIGKDGTDIKDHKCTWLVVMALMRMNSEQRALLESLYGKEDEESVNKVKDLYRQLEIPALYLKQEQDSYDRILKLINEAASTSSLPASLFLPILKKIHLREK